MPVISKYVYLVRTKDMLDKPNVQVSHPQIGKGRSSYFSQMGYITIDDKYIDPAKINKVFDMQSKSSIPKD